MKKRVLTKEKIVEAAADLCEKVGILNINFKILADELGIRSQSIYNHLINQNELKIELTYYYLRKLEETLYKSIIGKSGDIAVREFANEYRNYALNHPELYQTMTLLPKLGSEESLQKGTGITLMLEKILRFYPLHEENLVYKIRSLRSQVHGFVSLELAGYFKSIEERNASFDYMIQDYLKLLNQ